MFMRRLSATQPSRCLNCGGLSLGQKCRSESTGSRKRKPETRNREVSRNMNEISADGWCKTAENGSRQAIGEREPGSPHVDRHNLCQKNDHCTVVASEDARQPEFHRQQSGEGRRANQPQHCRISGDQHEYRENEEQGPTSQPVRNRTHHRKPEEVGSADPQSDVQTLLAAKMQDGVAESRRVSGDHVKRDGRHRYQHGSDGDNSPVCRK